MTEALIQAPDTNPYVTEDAFNDAIASLKQSIDALAQTVDLRIDTLRDSMRDETQQSIDDALMDEREKRESDIKELRDDVADIARKTDEMGKNIDNKLDKVTHSLGLMNGQLAKLDGTIGNWKTAMDSTIKRADELAGNVKETGEKVDLLENRLSQQQAKQDQLHKTIHGHGEEDGPDSLFALIRNLETTVTTRFDKQDGELQKVASIAVKNAETVATIQLERKAYAERWHKRRTLMISTIQALLSNKQFLAILGTVLVGIVIGIFPEARETLLSVLQFLLSGE